jgi:hypothetical protein
VLRAVCCGHIALGLIGPKVSPQETVAQLKGLRR